MDTVPAGMRAREHVEGLTLVFREAHSFGRRGVRWASAATVASLVFAVGMLVTLMALPIVLGMSSPLFAWWLAAFFGVVTLGPGAVALSGGLLAALVVRDAGRTFVHLTVGARGITVERPTEHEAHVFPPSEDLVARVDASARIPVLTLQDGHKRVRIPVLHREDAVQWLADRINDRCSGAGTVAAVPTELQAARRGLA
ncbi:MAG: hypothetical protein H6736_18115 [Alphaproteobacteria bacterium]|nr:hypothetical protein [Alphaproteobacteria bacterium]